MNIPRGKGLPESDIRSLIKFRRGFIKTLKRVGEQTNTPQHRIEAVVAREAKAIAELEAALQ